MSSVLNIKVLSLFLILLMVSCGGSESGSAKLIVVDFSAVDTDDRLIQDLEANVALQQSSESFFNKNKGTWNVVDQEMQEQGASSNFSFVTKSELKVDIFGDVPNFGSAHIISVAPYVVETVLEVGNGFGSTKTLLKTVTCEEFIGVVENRYLCGVAKLQTLELLSEEANVIQFRDTSDGEALVLIR